MYEQRAITREIWKLLVPMIAEQVLMFFTSVVTAAMIGRLMAEDIAAQAISSSLYNMSNYLFRAMNISLVSITSYHYGRGETAECRRALEQALLTAMPICFLLVTFVQMWPMLPLRLYTDKVEVLVTAVPYVRLLMFSLIPAAITSFFTASFQGHGDTLTPMAIAIATNLVNILLGWALIFGRLGLPALGLQGAGIALLIARTLGCLLALALLLNSRFGIRPFSRRTRETFRPDGRLQKDLYSMGLPIFCEHMSWQLAAIVVGRVIQTYGINAYAAYQQGLNAEGLLQTFADGFVAASVLLGARAIGMGDGKLYRAYFRGMLRICAWITIPSMLILFFFPTQLMSLLTDKADLILIGSLYVKIMCAAQPPQNFQRIVNGYIRVSGHKNVPALITAFGIWIVRVLLCLLFGGLLHWDIACIWWAVVADQMSRSILSTIFIVKKRVLHAADETPQTSAASA